MDLPLQNVFQKLVLRISGSGGKETSQIVPDLYTLEPGFYPLVDAGPLGYVRAINGNNMYLNTNQVSILKSLTKSGAIKPGAITQVGNNWYLAAWNDENSSDR